MEKIFHGLKLLTHCGGGAYGDVYYCEDISGMKMAVKIVSKHKLGNSWERELRGVIHYRKITENAPDLLQIFHVEEDDESFFYTMEPADSASDTEYIPDTLAHRLQSGPLPQADLFRILAGIFEGIKLIHRAGLTHRDIKPDNILFIQGAPKLADIGLLSSLSNSMTQLAGTLDFIPPEERSADSPGSADKFSRQRNDLYAFGKVIYCAATGLGPNEFPTVPGELELSPPVKYFLRLSFQLCSKDPHQRLSSIEKLSREFADIERKLICGEHFKDRVSYIWGSTLTRLKSVLFSSRHLLKHYWYLLILFILIGSGATYLIWKPETPAAPAAIAPPQPSPQPSPPLDITGQKTKEYVNAGHPISMTIPFHWEIVSRETLQEVMEKAYSNPENKRFTQKQREALLEMVRHGQEAIYCDFDEEFSDNITVSVSPMTRKELEETSEDEFRLILKTLFEGKLNFKTEIFASRKTTIAGHPAIFLDYTCMPDIRANGYWIALEDKTIVITMTAKNKTFQQRREEFNSVLTTLKIEK